MNDVTRIDYDGTGLSEQDIAESPWLQASRWVDEAVERAAAQPDVPEPHALSVATVDPDGAPNVRTVLMRIFDERGPGFLTNTDSTKGIELAAHRAIAASLTWPSMFRAIRFRGVAEVLTHGEVTDYFVTRPWGSRISAWTSRQSQPVASRAELEAAYETYAARWPDHGTPDDVPLPDFWGGYRIHCSEVEFWAGRRNRLHDRLVFTRVGQGSLADPAAWTLTRRQP